MDEILNAISGWLASVFDRIAGFISNAMNTIAARIKSAFDSIVNSIASIATQIRNFISEMWSTLIAQINAIVSDALGFLQYIYDRVANSITTLFDHVTDYLFSAFNTVKESVVRLADTVKNFIVDAFNFLKDKIQTFVSSIVLKVMDIFETVKNAIATIVDRAILVVNAIVQGIKDFIDSVINTIGGTLRTLVETAASIPDALAEAGAATRQSIEDFIGRPLGEIPSAIWGSLVEQLLETFGPDIARISESTRGALTGQALAARTRADFDRLFSEIIPESPTARLIFNTFIGIFLLVRLGSGIADANAQIALQEFGEEFPYNIPVVADAVKLKHFNIIDENAAVSLIRKQGFSEDHARMLVSIGETVPPEGEALIWWHRQIINDDQLDHILDKRGWTPESKQSLKQAAFFIPPVQDLITMAVREVFTPATAERFGQFEDFPEAFKDHARSVGLSEEWARNYWAAHWSLPSVQMGYEMLHRKVISEEDLHMLLKAADVMPFWRDKLVAISYAPFTRVDIRRMHKVGVLTDSEVFDAYQDIGYNTDKAQKLTDFTLELNKSKDADDVDELAKISRSSVLNFYEDGLIDRSTAHNMLIGIGLSSEGATLYLNSIDLDEQRRERKDETKLILDRAKAGLLSFNQAQDQLAALGLETRELTKAVTTLVRQEAQRTRLPSKEDLNKMYSQGLINSVQYTETLRLMGYSDFWSSKYLAMLGE